MLSHTQHMDALHLQLIVEVDEANRNAKMWEEKFLKLKEQYEELSRKFLDLGKKENTRKRRKIVKQPIEQKNELLSFDEAQFTNLTVDLDKDSLTLLDKLELESFV